MRTKENLYTTIGIWIQMIFVFPLDESITGIECNKFIP